MVGGEGVIAGGWSLCKGPGLGVVPAVLGVTCGAH